MTALQFVLRNDGQEEIPLGQTNPGCPPAPRLESITQQWQHVVIKVGGVIVWRELVSPENRAFICSISIASGGLLAILAQPYPPTPNRVPFKLVSSSRVDVQVHVKQSHHSLDWSTCFVTGAQASRKFAKLDGLQSAHLG